MRQRDLRRNEIKILRRLWMDTLLTEEEIGDRMWVWEDGTISKMSGFTVRRLRKKYKLPPRVNTPAAQAKRRISHDDTVSESYRSWEKRYLGDLE